METALPAGCVELCRACPHRSLSAQDSEKRKMDWLARRLSPWVPQIEKLISPPLERRWGYREKACLRAEPGGSQSNWRLGLRVPRPRSAGGAEKRPRQYDLIEIPFCPIHSERTRALFLALARALPDASEIPLAFVAVSGTLVSCVLKTRELPRVFKDPLFVSGLWEILKSHGATGLLVNLNAAAGERVFAQKNWHLIAGLPKAYRFEPDGSPMIYGPESFQQLLPGLHDEAMRDAERFLDPHEGSLLVDLYSGSGSSLKRWRARGARALGVELGGEAVFCARVNTGESNCLRGRASERIPQFEDWIAKQSEPAKTQIAVYANPPRMGLEPEILDWFCARLRPSKIAYLSCSAGTLARDLAVLTASGYCVRKIKAYDFFPNTEHIETLAFLERIS